MGAEVIWADFETRTESQLVDALVKMSTLGVPWVVLWEKWGTTQQEISALAGRGGLPVPGPAPARAEPQPSAA